MQINKGGLMLFFVFFFTWVFLKATFHLLKKRPKTAKKAFFTQNGKFGIQKIFPKKKKFAPKKIAFT